MSGVIVIDGLDDWALRLYLIDGALRGRKGHDWNLNVLGVANIVLWLSAVVGILIVVVIHLRRDHIGMIVGISLKICSLTSSNTLMDQFGSLVQL